MGFWQNATDNVMRICTETFRTDVVYTHTPLASTVNLKAIFDEAYVEVDLLDGASVQNQRPRLGIRKLDVTFYPDESDLVVIDGKNYQVVVVRPDGEAGYELLLDRVI